MYRVDLINAAMGAKRLTNESLGELTGLSAKTISFVRNGDPNVKLPTLRAVADALGLTMSELFEPREEAAPAAV
jgi:transcriptional regulator with XRE-family HTH domain